MNWYYADSGRQNGPVTDEQLDELFRSGKITAYTLVWCEGMPDWLPYQQAKPDAVPPSPPPASPGTWSQAAPGAVCAECGRMFNLDEMIRHGEVYICANCKPVFLQKLGEGAKIKTGMLEYAGFWVRFGAKFIDNLILAVVVLVPLFIFIFGFAFKVASGSSGLSTQHGSVFGASMSGSELLANFAGLFFQLIFMVVNGAYTIFFLGKYGATPGKMACRLKVVTADGGKIGYGRATGRFFAEILSGVICNIGYIIAGFDDQKRALHDHICNTRVVHK